jgi:hypothetical protein
MQQLLLLLFWLLCLQMPQMWRQVPSLHLRLGLLLLLLCLPHVQGT